MSEFEDLERMLRLKRYEKPREGFYEEFFAEFQSRQRSEMLRQSAHGLLFERISTWMWGLGNRRWLYAGGVAYAAVMIVVFLRPVSEMFAVSEGGEPAVVQEAKVPVPNEEDEASNEKANGLPDGIKALGNVRDLP